MIAAYALVALAFGAYALQLGRELRRLERRSQRGPDEIAVDKGRHPAV